MKKNYGFGKAERLHLNVDSTPGPGKYTRFDFNQIKSPSFSLLLI